MEKLAILVKMDIILMKKEIVVILIIVRLEANIIDVKHELMDIIFQIIMIVVLLKKNADMEIKI